MRNLIVLRGSPGSGKSTWIKENGLKDYTLCADDLRMLVQSPVLEVEKGQYSISQRNESYVWTLLMELLEKRMERGEFVIVDATHSRQSDFTKYNKLCERYRYRKYVVDFTDVPIEECKRRNAERESYKRVPEEVIDKMYARFISQKATSGWVSIPRDSFKDQIKYKPINLDKYTKIHIFGDVHGCFTPLNEYFKMYPVKDDEMYIFCGDYLDRGLENKATLELLIELSERKNFLFLEGNHEKWLWYYAFDELERVKSKTFLKHTAFEIQDIPKEKIRSFYRKIGQMAYFEFNDKKYIITHGGLSYVPENLEYIATDTLINGVGDYSINVDEIYSDNEKDIIQVHAHRNSTDIQYDDMKYSFNLEDKVEFGGFLRILILDKKLNKPRLVQMKNPIVGIDEFKESRVVRDGLLSSEIPILEQLQNSKSIKETKITDNISSFNFTRDAFYDKTWNSLTTRARGLFMNTETGEVVARAYNKFFNINERKETDLLHLSIKFKDKITCYTKYNGFLGIMSWVNDDLFLASKSTNAGDFADMFRNIFENSDINKEELKEYLKNNNVSLAFEVIDPVNDPHIIEYDKPRLILLDIIENSLEYSKRPYKEVVELGKKINSEYKLIYKEFDSYRDFYTWYVEATEEDNFEEKIEGVVIECDNMMVKLKFPYYNFWKFMRGFKEGFKRGSKIDFSKLYNAESNHFYNFLKTLPEEDLEKDIITLRKMFNKYIDNNIK